MLSSFSQLMICMAGRAPPAAELPRVHGAACASEITAQVGQGD